MHCDQIYPEINKRTWLTYAFNRNKSELIRAFFFNYNPCGPYAVSNFINDDDDDDDDDIYMTANVQSCFHFSNFFNI
jgi:hypothetical protein